MAQYKTIFCELHQTNHITRRIFDGTCACGRLMMMVDMYKYVCKCGWHITTLRDGTVYSGYRNEKA